MNNNRLAACVGFFLFIISLVLLLSKSTLDLRMCFIVSFALMAGGITNEAMGEK